MCEHDSISEKILKDPLNNINPSCTKVFGTHTFYEGKGGGVEPTPHDLENGRL